MFNRTIFAGAAVSCFVAGGMTGVVVASFFWMPPPSVLFLAMIPAWMIAWHFVVDGLGIRLPLVCTARRQRHQPLAWALLGLTLFAIGAGAVGAVFGVVDASGALMFAVAAYVLLGVSALVSTA